MTGRDNKIVETSETFDNTSQQIARLVNGSWFSRYPRCKYSIYDNGSEFKLHFRNLCETYGLKRKPATIKNPHANAILEDTISEEDVSNFLDDTS